MAQATLASLTAAVPGEKPALTEDVEVEAAERRPCPGCGVVMDRANVLQMPSGERHLFFRHEDRCPPAVRQRKAADALKARGALAGMFLAGKALPPATVDRATGAVIDSLPVYEECFRGSYEAAAATHHKPVTISRRFLAFVVGERRAPKTGFCFAGKVGAGKTTLLNAVARDFVRAYVGAGLRTNNQCPVVWWKEQALWECLTEGMDRPEFDSGAVTKPLIDAPLLVLDNLGGQAPTPWWIDTVLFHALDARYQAGKPTLATSKFTLDGLKALWEKPGRGGAAKCAEDLIDRLREVMIWTPMGGGSNRVPKVDF